MRVRRSWVALACAAGAAAAVVPALTASADPPSTVAFEATDFSWHVAGNPASMSVPIATGGTVTFGYPRGVSEHNVDFTSGPATPSCSLNGGSAVAATRVPANPVAPGWTASCTFETPGTYTFKCDFHSNMVGTIQVGDAATPPPSRTTTTGGTAPPPPGTGTGASPGTSTTPSGGRGGAAPGGGGAGSGMSDMPGMSGMSMGGAGGGATGTAGKGTTHAPAPTTLVRSLKVARAQHGTRVTGSFTLGGSAKAKLAVQVSAKGLHPALAGKLTRTDVRPGRVTFAVPLTKAARRALVRKHTLTLNLKVVVTPAHGHASTRMLALKLRR